MLSHLVIYMDSGVLNSGLGAGVVITWPAEVFPQLSALQISLGNRYIYGKPVQGVAYTRFALMDEDGKRTFLRGLETQTKVGCGEEGTELGDPHKVGVW